MIQLPMQQQTERPGRAAGYMTDAEWAEHMIWTLPARWQDSIRTAWRGKWSMMEEQRRAANLEVLHAVRDLQDAQRAGLRPDATDEQIAARARVFSRHYERATMGKDSTAAAAWALEEFTRHGVRDLWPGWKPGQPGKVNHKRKPAACVARACCETFWRRVLRKVFARTIEACSIGLGLVNKDRDCYVSSLSVSRRRQQVARNAASLEATELENEYGQRMKLSDLAAKSTANKTVRRAELMTRISGFDKIAREVGHDATFVTLTCPSRMHKWTDTKNGVVPNRKYDGTKPGDAQKYLAKQWTRCRAFFKRQGVDLYGFRVAEPHHDGCPHWHLLLFHEPAASGNLRRGLVRYFLENDSATERGAVDVRITIKKLDPNREGAAAYIAKYISKNIDGYAVGADLYGAPAMESSQRVDAWAATWGIRQFQQLGGAPVTVWRELRRINTDELPRDLLPEQLTQALSACNLGQTGALWADGWAMYTKAQGGPCAARKRHAVRLLRIESGEVNRYTETKPADVVGIECHGRNWHKPAHMVAMLGEARAPRIQRPASARLESERAQWRIVGQGAPVPALPDGEAVRPWTRVNNCTRRAVVRPEVMRDAVLIQRGKTGRYRSFPASKGAGGPSTIESDTP